MAVFAGPCAKVISSWQRIKKRKVWFEIYTDNKTHHVENAHSNMRHVVLTGVWIIMARWSLIVLTISSG